jgi:SNARE protein
MTDIQYWDDTLTEEIEAISDMVEKIPSMDNPAEKAEAIDRCLARIDSAAGTKRSFKMEIRLVQDVGQRRNYEARLQQLDQQLQTAQADCKALESETARGELFVEADTNGNGGEGMDGVKAGDNMLKDASGIQDKTQDSLANTKALIAESKEVGVSTLEELQRQREVLHNIERETDRLDDNLARAEQLVKQFGKRMAGDQFIQCFAVVNVLLLIAVLLYAIIKKGGLSSGDDGTPPDPAGRRVLTELATDYYYYSLRGSGTTRRE